MRHPKSQKSTTWGYIVLAFNLIIISSLSIWQCIDVYNTTQHKKVTVVVPQKEGNVLSDSIEASNDTIDGGAVTGDNGSSAISAMTDNGINEIVKNNQKEEPLLKGKKNHANGESKSDKKVTEKETGKSSSNDSTQQTLQLAYGTWNGPVKNGRPNGKATIIFNKSVLVTNFPNDIYAQKGYTLRNAMFVNGKLLSGTLYDNEGKEIRFIVSDIKL